MSDQKKQIFIKYGEHNRNYSFESRCPIGEPLLFETYGVKFYSIFRGVSFERYVLVDFPTRKGKRPRLDYNTSINVRYLDDGKVYEFKTHVLRSHSTPSLVALEYPDTILEVDLRKSKRINYFSPLKILTKHGDTTDKAAILNISSDGALIGINEPCRLEKNCKVLLEFKIPTHPGELSIEAQIRKVRDIEGKNLAGVSFEKVQAAPYGKISSFYSHCRKFL